MYAICYLFIKLKHFFASIEFQKFGPVGIPIIILVLELFPVACIFAMNGKDGCRLKLDKVKPTFY